MSKARSRRMSEVEWDEFVGGIAFSVLEGLDYWCFNVSGDDPLDCLTAHADRSLYELAEEFAEWERSGITEKDLKLLKRAPERVYRKWDKYVKEAIDEAIEKLRREYQEYQTEEYQID